jgi:hypothetical protein
MSDYTESVQHYMRGLGPASVGIADGCPDCGDVNPEDMEPVFSWGWCDACGSSYGGDRYPAHALDNTGEMYHLDVCVDCVQYIANGDEPEQWRQRPEWYGKG